MGGSSPFLQTSPCIHWMLLVTTANQTVFDLLRCAFCFGVNSTQRTDDLHTPHAGRDRTIDYSYNIFTFRGIANLGFLLVLGVGLLALL